MRASTSPPGLASRSLSRGQAGREAEAAFGDRIDGAAHEDAGLDAVGEHAVELDARRDAAHVAAGGDGCGHLAPVVDAGIEDVHLVAVEVLGGEDLQVAEAVVDGAFAKAPKHAGKEAADQEQPGHASADHDQGHERAAAIAKDVSKG